MAAGKYLPFFIFRPDILGFIHCEILPGVTLRRPTRREEQLLSEWFLKFPPQYRPSFPINITIEINIQKYELSLLNRMTEEGLPADTQYEKVPDTFRRPGFLAAGYSAFKHVIMCLTLLGCAARTPPVAFDFETTKNGPLFASGGPAAPRSETNQAFVWHAGEKPPSIIKPKILKAMCSVTERYYRPLIWHADRLSVALESYWEAVFSAYPLQSYASLMISVEALLSTSPQEVTHQICERTAIMFGNGVDDRLSIYKTMKRLYAVRSKIVHGVNPAKKGKTVTPLDLHIDAKNSHVGKGDFGELGRIVRLLLISVLKDDRFRMIIQAQKSEGKISEDLDEYMTRRLFGEHSRSYPVIRSNDESLPLSS